MIKSSKKAKISRSHISNCKKIMDRVFRGRWCVQRRFRINIKTMYVWSLMTLKKRSLVYFSHLKEVIKTDGNQVLFQFIRRVILLQNKRLTWLLVVAWDLWIIIMRINSRIAMSDRVRIHLFRMEQAKLLKSQSMIIHLNWDLSHDWNQL